MSTDQPPAALVWHTTLHHGRAVIWTSTPGGEPATGRVVSVLDTDPDTAHPARLISPDGHAHPMPGQPHGLTALGGGVLGRRPLLADLGTLLPEYAQLGAEIAAGRGLTHSDLTNPAGPDPDPLVGYDGWAVHSLTVTTARTYHTKGRLPAPDDHTPRGRPLWRTSTITGWDKPEDRRKRGDLETSERN